MDVMGPAVEVEDLIGYGSKGVRRRGPMEEVEVMIGGCREKDRPKMIEGGLAQETGGTPTFPTMS
jgi:hypothetical protein